MRIKYLTDTSSDIIVSPIAHRLCDLAAGHCIVRVLLHIPFAASCANLPDDSTPAMELTMTFTDGDCGDAEGVEFASRGVSEDTDRDEG